MSSFDYKTFLKTLTVKPGVYRMLDESGDILYVGKAKNLKNRVSSYFRSNGLTAKTAALVKRIRAIEVTITGSETEALLLEQVLIKNESPPYNILLRDDKSYPYILLSKHEDYPSLTFKRARKKGKDGTYFGPFPSAGAVRESLVLMERIFKIRQCDESVFRNRSRPCLQYQIKRCSGPCVGLVSPEQYLSDIQHAVMFLQGKNPDLIKELMSLMQGAAETLDFEKAAIIRDQISHLRHVQEKQAIEGGDVDIDVIVAAERNGVVCIQMVYVRGGRVIGNKSFFPKLGLEDGCAQVLSEFVAQYYIGGRSARDFPKEILLNIKIQDQEILADALKNVAHREILVKNQVRSERAQWLKLAENNVVHSLSVHLSNKLNLAQRYEALSLALDLGVPPSRMECFDISHSHGESTVASCVVFNENGPLKQDYRQYNIENITAGDDYEAMRQALTKRYQKRVGDISKLPDIVFIDGGKGQLGVAKEVFTTLGIDSVLLIGVGKGVTRKPGLETIIRGDNDKEVIFAPNAPGLHLIQQIRDEAHRFAVTGHRARRDKKRKRSVLEDLEGVGPKRRKALINYFGGLQQIMKAGPDEIAKVSGISKNLAETIYESLHQP